MESSDTCEFCKPKRRRYWEAAAISTGCCSTGCVRPMGVWCVTGSGADQSTNSLPIRRSGLFESALVRLVKRGRLLTPFRTEVATQCRIRDGNGSE